MSTILEFDSAQEKLEINWEVVSNSSSQETPFEERCSDHLRVDQERRAANELLEVNDSLESKDTLLQDDHQSSLTGEDEILGPNIDFHFEFDNPAFLHSFFFTMLFFVGLFIIFSTICFIPSFQRPTYSSIVEPNAAVSAFSFKFEHLGQNAGKTADHAIDAVYNYLQSEGFHQKIASFKEKSSYVIDKMINVGESVLDNQSWLWKWMKPQPLLVVNDPCKEKFGILSTFLYRICTFFWPPNLIPASLSSIRDGTSLSYWFEKMRSVS